MGERHAAPGMGPVLGARFFCKKSALVEPLYWVRAARLLLSAAPEHLFAPRFKALWNRRYPDLPWDASRGGLLVDGSPSFELELPGTVTFERGSASIMLTAEDLRGLLPKKDVRFTLRAPGGSLPGEYRVTPGKPAAEYSASRLPVDPTYSGPLGVELRVLCGKRCSAAGRRL